MLTVTEISLATIAEHIGARLRGDPDLSITGIDTLQDADVGQIAFLANPVYRKYLATTRASAVILTADDAAGFDGNAVITENPYAGYAKLTALFVAGRSSQSSIHPSTTIAADAVIGKNVVVGPHAVIESGVRVGAECEIGAHCVVGKDTHLGSQVVLHPNVVIYSGVSVGNGCIFHSGVVIGADGFGFAPDGEQWVKIHQLGGVLIGDNVELGAGTCIDRGALGNTEIGDGVKIDNLVQVGHNCKIGSNTVISGCAAIAGSAVVGKNCLIGGGVGIVGHLTVADGVMITARTLVTRSITQPGSYSSGTNCTETSRWRKNAVRFGQLEQLNQRVKRLEKARIIKDPAK